MFQYHLVGNHHYEKTLVTARRCLVVKRRLAGLVTVPAETTTDGQLKSSQVKSSERDRDAAHLDDRRDIGN